MALDQACMSAIDEVRKANDSFELALIRLILYR
jgi:hypothetical protein